MPESQQTPPQSSRAAQKRVNVIGLLVVSILAIILCFMATVAFNYIVAFLTDFIVNQMRINEFYVGKMIGLFFGFCLSALILVLFMIDGEDRRLRKFFGKYVSSWVVEDYYQEKDAVAAPSSGDTLPVDAAPDSTRAGASVRPKASVVEDDYKQGKVEGAFKEFYPNGNIKKECRYIGGKLEGLFRTFYQDGQIEQETVYRGGEIEGTYRSYYEDGKLHQDKNYINGKLNGVYKAFDEQGIPFFEITYKDDIQHGTDKIYDQVGVMQYMDTYRDGVMVNRKTYDEFGGLKFDQNFEEPGSETIESRETASKIFDRENTAKEKRRGKSKKEETDKEAS